MPLFNLLQNTHEFESIECDIQCFINTSEIPGVSTMVVKNGDTKRNFLLLSGLQTLQIKI